ncbi:MAG: hypothetical protein AAB596_00410 [Patescibacteria group bacterium]
MEKRKQYDNKIILPRREEHELPKGKAGLVLCRDCGASYYKKYWHHNLRNYKNPKEDALVRFSVCPACKMIENRQFEGKIVVENIPAKILSDLTNLAENFCRKAYLSDPLDRLIKIKKIKEGVLEITTTENQLAVRLAKKIKETFKKDKNEISYSPRPSDVVYVKISFKL